LKSVRGIGRLKICSVGLMDLIAANKVTNSILVHGFWRSGTTWLQQTLVNATGSKSLFEPYSPASGHKWSKLDRNESEASRSVYLPLSAAHLSSWERFKLDLSLRGVGMHGYTHFLRQSPAEAWSEYLVVKFTRLGFLLDFVADRSDAQLIHLRRNLAAVYASFKETDWSWRFEDVRFSEIYKLEDYDAGSDEHEIVSILRQHDDTPEQRLAALWSLSEQFAQRAISAGKAHLVLYEDMLDQGAEILNSLNIGTFNIASNDAASPVSNAGRERLSSFARKHDWKTRLTASEIDTIISVCRELYPENGYFQENHSLPSKRQKSTAASF
jgi:Sulfotransferase family